MDSGVCTPCPAGYSCADPAIGAVVCNNGTYQTATGQSSCDDCPAGQECPTSDGAAIDCDAGYFSPLGSSVCSVNKPRLEYN